MKKVLVFLVLIMAVMVVNAQTTNACDTIRTTVEIVDLQKAITDNIAKDYVDYTITEATMVTIKGIVTYEIVIINEAVTEMLVYDKDGVFIKKLLSTPIKKTDIIMYAD